MKKFVKKYLLMIIGLIAGGIAGYFYWKLVGCSSGSCSITSSPLNSSIYGAVMGGLLFSMFRSSKKQTV